ncbi:Gfo/Idh/MocA family oxidoreductase [Actinophytocola sp.]|uniref:Gfo/Idh/MocA family oxidoreductase n=1 Tax=Actinophytocola sp. TaxID=1872138 RepID=UPI003899E687
MTEKASAARKTATMEYAGLRTLVVGLGNAGANLHLPVLNRLRAEWPALFAVDPPLGCDPRHAPGAAVVTTVDEAVERLDPRHTVVHLCTPPADRTDPLRTLAAAGFDKVLVEKPLATGTADLDRIVALRARLDLVVVAQWLTSELTSRLAALVALGTLGALTDIRFVQRKSRFQRSSTTAGHPTAFDVELPHSVGVALLLAGDAEVHAARCQDLTTDAWTLPRLGGAQVELRHHGGVRTEIVSDLGAPVRERSVVLNFERGTVTGHYPPDASDPYARLSVHAEDGGNRTSVFPDDALATFLLSAYRYFAGAEVPSHTDLNIRVARLLCDAKRQALGAWA